MGHVCKGLLFPPGQRVCHSLTKKKQRMFVNVTTKKRNRISQLYFASAELVDLVRNKCERGAGGRDRKGMIVVVERSF
jgi:hypothetical protein